MALASLHALARIKSTRAAAFRGLDALTVDDTGRRNRVAPDRDARPPHQRSINPTPDPLIPPSVEVVLDRRARRKILRQRPPLTPRRCDIEDRVHDGPQINKARATEPLPSRHQARNQRPLRVRHVACVTKTLPPILRTGDFSPGHEILHRRFATTTESQTR